jgi:NAD(P)H-dependent FMN reductase
VEGRYQGGLRLESRPSPHEKELIEFVGGRIARYKKPQYVQFVESLPEKNGSIDREVIKELYGGEQTPQRLTPVDAVSVFERMIAADALIYGSPLYCWNFTAQMKALIDRHICLVAGYGTVRHHSLITEKPTALLVTCAGPVKGNADVIQTVFERMGIFCNTRVVNKNVVPFCTTPEALGEDARAAARKLAGDIDGALRQ